MRPGRLGFQCIVAAPLELQRTSRRQFETDAKDAGGALTLFSGHLF
jgi:hypothetical protein